MLYLSIYRTSIVFLAGILYSGCATSDHQTTEDDSSWRPRAGRIAYPFVKSAGTIGNDVAKDPFVIRSSSGGTEYAVEIPSGGDRYDIEVPLAQLNPPYLQESGALGIIGSRAPNPVSTDREILASLPSMESATPKEAALLNRTLQAGDVDGPRQSPSYTMGIARANQYYKDRKFELALIEVNNLLAFYPTSSKLHKMKGTLHLKSGDESLALRSWQRAKDLDPSDTKLHRSSQRLQERLLATQPSRTISPAVANPKPTSQSSPLLSPIPQDQLPSSEIDPVLAH